MEVICRSRQAGKTHDLIKRCYEEGGYIVCASRREADRVHGVAEQMGLDVPQPITFLEFVQQKYHPEGVKKFHIDNVDMCVQMISKVPVSTVTLTGVESKSDPQ